MNLKDELKQISNSAKEELNELDKKEKMSKSQKKRRDAIAKNKYIKSFVGELLDPTIEIIGHGLKKSAEKAKSEHSVSWKLKDSGELDGPGISIYSQIGQAKKPEFIQKDKETREKVVTTLRDKVSDYFGGPEQGLIVTTAEASIIEEIKTNDVDMKGYPIRKGTEYIINLAWDK